MNWLVLVVQDVKLNKVKEDEKNEGGSQKLSPSDYYIENGKYVFTEVFHIKRGHCCGNSCRHCAYYPKYQKGNTNIFINNG